MATDEASSSSTPLDSLRVGEVNLVDLSFLPPYFQPVSLLEDHCVLGYVSTEDEADNVLECFERETKSRFISYTDDLTKPKDKLRLFWCHKFLELDGVPFAIVRRRDLACQYGRPMKPRHSNPPKRMRCLPSKKVNCPAKASICFVRRYEKFSLPTNASKRRQRERMDVLKAYLAEGPVPYTLRVFLRLPLAACHENHSVQFPMNSQTDKWVAHFEWHSHALHGYVKSLEAIIALIKDFSLSTTTKYFPRFYKKKKFGCFNPDEDSIKQKIIFEEEEDETKGEAIDLDGIPFMVVGRKECCCRQAAETDPSDDDHGNYCEGENTSDQLCPAKILLREVIAFPNFKIPEDTEKHRKEAIARIKIALLCKEAMWQRLFFVDLPPLGDHLHCADAKDLKKKRKVVKSTDYSIGVDVGTGSVRAALVAANGDIVSVATQEILVYSAAADFYEQSSEEIWQAVCACVRALTDKVEISRITGIGFDATCSLVVLDGNHDPISVSLSDNFDCNVIMWMDHRAKEQADAINATKDKVLSYVGGSISLEMQVPKLLWLKENMKSCWDSAAHFFDLPDFLTWRATGSHTRSLCSVVCKMTYLAGEDAKHGWSEEFFRKIGLGDLADNFEKIGTETSVPGEACGLGLTSTAAEELGLNPGTAVATSIIDAHAGTLGVLGSSPKDTWRQRRSLNLSSKMALICGTSSCHMTVSREPLFVKGVWGPYYSVIVPGMWCNEGGQSASGKLLDHIVENHPAYSAVKEEADKLDTHPHQILNSFLEAKSNSAMLTGNIHIWPDFHGNRSPLADPNLRGMMSGVTLATDLEDLAVKYLATIQALAYGTRHILDTMKEAGQRIEMIIACGGLSKNHVYIQTHADVLGIKILLPEVTESVLLGSAMLAATASGLYASVQEAMFHMGSKGELVSPNSALQSYHDRKYRVFLKMHQHQEEYKRIMQDEELM